MTNQPPSRARRLLAIGKALIVAGIAFGLWRQRWSEFGMYKTPVDTVAELIAGVSLLTLPGIALVWLGIHASEQKSAGRNGRQLARAVLLLPLLVVSSVVIYLVLFALGDRP